MDQIVLIFLLELAQKSCYFTHPWKYFANIDGLVTFLLYDLIIIISFLNDMHIELILELKKSYGKYHLVCL